MADLRISELPALAGANLAAGDLLPIVDVSASETKKITVTDLVGNATTLIADATIPSAKVLFGAGSIVAASLATDAVTTAKIQNDAVTAAKLADESTVDLVTTLPASGAFVGQIALDTDDSNAYIWNGSSWVSFKAAGSVGSVVGSTAGTINIVVTTSGNDVTVSATLDNTSAAAQFLAGPAANAGAVSYRTITGADLPAPTTSARGGVAINGEGLRMDGAVLEIDNDVTANVTYGLVTYNAKGLVTNGRTIISSDLPAATSVAKGAVIPGTGLSVDGSGNLNHTNSATPGTYTKVTVDSQGHVSSGAALASGDLPNHSAALLTSGSLDIARIDANSITGAKLANYAVSKIGETQPTADHIGQFFFNPLSRDLFLWDGNVFQPIGISVGEIVFAGTFDASAGGGTGLVASVTAEGTAIGLVVGQALPAAATANNRYYLVVAEAGTITSGNAPQVALSPPDIILSNGSAWTEIDVSQTITAQVASNVSFTPAGNISATNVQTAIEELDSEKVPLSGGTITGELLIGTSGSFAFEGTSSNAYETYLAVVDPTADRTITFPDISGTVITTGDTGTVTSTMIADGTIVNADISATAEIAVSKLADGAARQLLQTAANGTDVEWTDNVDIPGTLDVTGAATFDSSVAVTGALTKSGSNVVTVGDTGTVTSAMIADGTIVNADVNASAAIAGTKISPDFGSQTIATTGIFSHALGTAGAPTVTFTGDTNTGIYSPGADQVAISTGGSGRLFVDASGNATIGAVADGLAASGQRLKVTGGTIEFDPGSGADSTRAFNFNIGATNFAKLLVPSGSGGALAIHTGGVGAVSERLRITSAGLVGVGTLNPGTNLDVSSASNTVIRAVTTEATGASIAGIQLDQTGSGASSLIARAGGNYTLLYATTSTPMLFGTNNTERARIDSSGRLLVGTSSARAVGGQTQPIQNESISSTGVNFIRNSNDAFSPYICLGKSRGTSLGSSTIVNINDALGGIIFAGADDTDINTQAATIVCQVDGTPGADDMPGRLVFSTTADGASSPTERLRISQNGVVTIKNGAVAEIGTLTDGATITPNFASNCNFTVTLGGNRTIANPTNLTAGQSGSIFLVQDATGSRTASWGSYWDFAGGTAPTLTTTANAVDRVDYVVRSATSIHTVFTANYS